MRRSSPPSPRDSHTANGAGFKNYRRIYIANTSTSNPEKGQWTTKSAHPMDQQEESCETSNREKACSDRKFTSPSRQFDSHGKTRRSRLAHKSIIFFFFSFLPFQVGGHQIN